MGKKEKEMSELEIFKQRVLFNIDRTLDFTRGCIELIQKNYDYNKLSENGKMAYFRVITPILFTIQEQGEPESHSDKQLNEMMDRKLK
jgi:hypothetical protein